MKAGSHILISTLLCIALATPGGGAAALVVVAAAVYVVVQFWPLFLIGGTAVVAIKASNRRSS